MNYTKRCNKCQGVFEINNHNFYMKEGKLDTSSCKECKKQYRKQYHIKNRDKILEQKREYGSRPEVIKQTRKTKNNYYNNKLKYNTGNQVRVNLSKRIRDYINKSGSSVLDFIGCSIDDLKSHLEKSFTDGMSWENYGVHGWHIDHIRPCCSFDLTDPEQQRECFHYTNLQPLWAEDNLAKGGRYEFPRNDE